MREAAESLYSIVSTVRVAIANEARIRILVEVATTNTHNGGYALLARAGLDDLRECNL
jgi:hypothetical protein